MHLTGVLLSAEQARRLALSAQGLSATPSHRRAAGAATLMRALTTMHLLQIDSVNVLTRSHYLPLFARVGHYRQPVLDQLTLAARTRRTFEYWGHEASFIPFELHPLLRWRMARARDGDGPYRQCLQLADEQPGYVAKILDFVRRNGPTRARDLPEAGMRRPEWWSWSPGKTALEYLFWTGQVTCAQRRGFERIYDVPERVVPGAILAAATPSEDDAIRQLVRLSADALGIATVRDLRDYFRLPLAPCRKAVGDLVESGELLPARVAGWSEDAYLSPRARLPARATPSALLSPFDPLVWNRDRARRLFAFDYRLEIYTPARKRRYGYYVLPWLHRGRLEGRVCLKSQRQDRVLQVNACHGENHGLTASSAAGLAAHLQGLARFLGLDEVKVAGAGNSAAALSAALHH